MEKCGFHRTDILHFDDFPSGLYVYSLQIGSGDEKTGAGGCRNTVTVTGHGRYGSRSILELVVRKDNTMKLFGKKAQPKKEEPKMQEAVLTLYACRKDVKTVPDLACRLFSEVMDKILYTDEDEFHIQFKDGTGVQFHLVTDAEETEVQSKGMASFFSRAPLENEAVKDAAPLPDSPV